MALLTYPHIERNTVISSHQDLNDNFNAISALVNGSLGGDNFSLTADLTCNTLTLATLDTPSIVSNGPIIIKLPSSDGSNSVTFLNNLSVTVLQIKSNGVVTFSGATPFLPIGTVLMYNGTAIPNSDTRSTDLEEILLYGWYVCNGQASTPDLRNKFILGATTAGTTGGSNDAQVPQHNHTVASVSNNSINHQHTISDTSQATSMTHTHGYSTMHSGNTYIQGMGAGSNTSVGSFSTDNGSGSGHTHTFSITSGNESAAHSHTGTTSTYTPGNGGTGRNIPPYYSLIFIRRMS
jgi:hypothetical protein